MNLRENLGLDILRESDSFLVVQGYQGDQKCILEVFPSESLDLFRFLPRGFPVSD